MLLEVVVDEEASRRGVEVRREVVEDSVIAVDGEVREAVEEGSLAVEDSAEAAVADGADSHHEAEDEEDTRHRPGIMIDMAKAFWRYPGTEEFKGVLFSAARLADVILRSVKLDPQPVQSISPRRIKRKMARQYRYQQKRLVTCLQSPITLDTLLQSASTESALAEEPSSHH